MNGDDFPGVDLDLLADYVGGALDDPAERQRVAGLVATDPVWLSAYDLLTYGVSTVTTELQGLGDEPIPVDVAERIDAALAALAPVPLTHAPAPDLEQAHRPGRHLRAVPSSKAGLRRPRRWAAPIAVAAGVLAVAGVGITQLLARDPAPEAATSAAAKDGAANKPLSDRMSGGAQADEAAPYAGKQVVPDAAHIAAGDTDYRSGTVGAVGQSFLKTERSGGTVPQADPAGSVVVPADRIDPSLRRLAGREALASCLDAITVAHGTTINTQGVEYARFEGSPAVVVRFTAADGTWVWVSGARCGTPGADADTLYQVKVG